MPPDMKEQIQFAKLNQTALKYLWGLAVVIIVLGGVFAGAFYMINQNNQAAAAELSDKQQQITTLKKSFLPQAQDASQRLNAIAYVQSTQTRFSSVIADISQVFPQGVSIDSFTLTGDASKPVELAVSAVTYDQILALRNALVTSPRIAGADIETISSQATPPDYNFKGNLIIAFKPGEAE